MELTFSDELFSDMLDEDGVIRHYGTPRHSGRYPWGSGEDPYQHETWFKGFGDDIRIGSSSEERPRLSNIRTKEEQKKYDDYWAFRKKVYDMRKTMNEAQICQELGIKSNELRSKLSIAKNYTNKMDLQNGKYLEEHGYSESAAARELGLPVTTYASMKRKGAANIIQKSQVVDRLRDEVAAKTFIDISSGAEAQLGVSRTTFKNAYEKLKSEEGYVVEDISVEQVTNPGNKTTVRVLAPPGTDPKDISRRRTEITTIIASPDAKQGTVLGLEKPTALDSSRVHIRYSEDGGLEKDGVIEIRRGVKDISLGKDCSYAQVRINVDDKFYMKGMCVYAPDEDFPPGCDVIFNSNKTRGTDISEVLKKLKKDKTTNEINWANPFGAVIKEGTGEPDSDVGQVHYRDEKGDIHLGVINKVREEGDWDKWSKTLSPQVLGKQPAKLISERLEATLDQRKQEYEAIMAIPNSTVKEKLLKDFANTCDANSVDLKAVGFNRQVSKVILPLNSLPKGHVYAPTFEDGEQVILIRYPHQGRFEIPILTVDNHNKEGRYRYQNMQDGIGIRHETAAQLSGADYDGDSVSVIPIRGIEHDILVDKVIPELRDFEPKVVYKRSADDKRKTGEETSGRKFETQSEMGIVSNLITDMTIKNAPTEHIVRAVKYAMLVIDAEKHNLDWQQAAKDFNMTELHKLYQGKARGGASTLLSRSKGRQDVPERDLHRPQIDPETGKLTYPYKMKTVVDPETGEVTRVPTGKKMKSTKGAEHEDARELMSNPNGGYYQEELYADFSNKLKAMANEARKVAVNLKHTPKDPIAEDAFAPEVSSLMAKYNEALKYKPYEHIAQIQAGKVVREQVRILDPDHTMPWKEKEKEVGKIRQQALSAKRQELGAGSSGHKIEPTDREWEALTSNAFTPTMTQNILENMKTKAIKQHAMPKEKVTISPGTRAIIMKLASKNPPVSIADIASRTGLSPSTVSLITRNKM